MSCIFNDIMNNNLSNIRDILEKKIDVNHTNVSGESLLYCAIKDNKFDIIKFLIDNGADVNLANKSGISPLHLLSSIKITPFTENIFELLIKAGANVNSVDKHGNTPLHFACVHDEIGIVSLLINNGADVNYKNLTGGNTCLHLAVMYEYEELINLLLNRTINLNVNIFNNDGHTPLEMALQSNNSNIINSCKYFENYKELNKSLDNNQYQVMKKNKL